MVPVTEQKRQWAADSGVIPPFLSCVDIAWYSEDKHLIAFVIELWTWVAAAE